MRWQFFSDRFFLSAILFSLILHLILAFFPGLTFDMNYWFNWSERLQQFGFSNFYTTAERTDYLPGYLYILYFLGFIKNYFHLNDVSSLYLLKLPGIFSEILLAAIIYLVLLKFRGLRTARLGLLFICLNPAFIFNSAIWGQVDSLLTLFLLLTITALSMNRLFLTGIFFGASLLLKPQALSILPVLFLNIICNFSASRFLKIFLITCLFILTFSLPFFGSHVVTGFLTHLQNTANEYPYNSLSAYNLWGIFGFWIEDSHRFLGMTYYHWGIFFYLIFWVIILLVYLKKNYNLYIMTTLATLSFYYLPTRVHERYLYPALVFLFLCSLILKNRTLIILALVLSFLHFINLLHVYLRYNGYLLNFTQYFNPLYQLLERNITLLSSASIILFICITIILIKRNHVKRGS